MNTKNFTDQNSIKNTDSDTNESLWLSDSYNLLHHNGRIKRTQPQSIDIRLINLEEGDTNTQSQISVDEGEKDHYQMEKERERERKHTHFRKGGVKLKLSNLIGPTKINR